MTFTALNDFVNTASGYLWGWPMLILLLGTGLWLTVVLGGLQFRLLIPSLVKALSGQPSPEQSAISNRSALMTALAATVGTGNIAGVATAIALGGPGAVFWMWLTGLVGMALKYSETLLGVHYRIRTTQGYQGGPMHYLRTGLGGNLGAFLGGLYALFLAFGALSVGGMVQSNSMADAMLSGFGTSPVTLGALVTAAAALIMFGGVTRIARVADRLVPTMILLYAATGTFILILNAAYIPAMLHAIFTQAFTGSAAAGGFAGSTLLLTMRYGLARGVFANESGLGSAAVVSATAHTRHPTEQALVAMTQTFIDTFFVCTFTALVVLVTGAWQAQGVQSGGAALTNMAFSTGLAGLTIHGISVGGAIVTACLFLFAFTTILGWGYYGQQGAVFLFGNRIAKPYLVLFLLATFFGAAVLQVAESIKQGVQFIWAVADVTVGAMMVPNLLALLLLTPKIRRLTTDFLSHTRHGKPLTHPAFHHTPISTKPTPKASTRSKNPTPKRKR